MPSWSHNCPPPPNTALFKTPGIFLILFSVQIAPYLRSRSLSHSSLGQTGFISVVLAVCVQTSVLSCVSPRLTAVRVGLLNAAPANLTAGNCGNYCVNLVSGPIHIVCFFSSNQMWMLFLYPFRTPGTRGLERLVSLAKDTLTSAHSTWP